MKTITALGFRCFTSSFSYVILRGHQSNPQLIKYASVKIPSHLSGTDSKAYCWLRKEVIEILNSHQIDFASIKIAEKSARKPSIKRAELEAIVKEATYSHSGILCVPRLKMQLKKNIEGFDDPARYIVRVLGDVGLTELSKPAYEEATVSCLSVLPS